MNRVVSLGVVAVLLAVAGPTRAEKPAAKPKLTGSWSRTVDDNTVTFEFEGGQLRCLIKMANGASLDIAADYGVTKAGVLYGVITKATEKGIGNTPDEGTPFSFQVEVKKDELTLKSFRAPDAEQAKTLLEGTYKPAKAKEGK